VNPQLDWHSTIAKSVPEELWEKARRAGQEASAELSTDKADVMSTQLDTTVSTEETAEQTANKNVMNNLKLKSALLEVAKAIETAVKEMELSSSETAAEEKEVSETNDETEEMETVNEKDAETVPPPTVTETEEKTETTSEETTETPVEVTKPCPKKAVSEETEETDDEIESETSKSRTLEQDVLVKKLTDSIVSRLEKSNRRIIGPLQETIAKFMNEPLPRKGVASATAYAMEKNIGDDEAVAEGEVVEKDLKDEKLNFQEVYKKHYSATK